MRGVHVEAVLSGNGSAYKSHAWRDACRELGIKHRRTRPYRPQTNGKIERFHRTLAGGWAYSKHYNSENARRAALPAWLHFYNHHRQHSAIGKVPPITRLNNLPEHNIETAARNTASELCPPGMDAWGSQTHAGRDGELTPSINSTESGARP